MKSSMSNAGGRKKRRGRRQNSENMVKLLIGGGAILLLAIGIMVGSFIAKGSKKEDEEYDLAKIEESIPEEEEVRMLITRTALLGENTEGQLVPLEQL